MKPAVNKNARNPPPQASVIGRAGFWLGMLLFLPFAPFLLLGEGIAAPFTSRRHRGAGWWWISWALRTVFPAIAAGMAMALLVRWLGRP